MIEEPSTEPSSEDPTIQDTTEYTTDEFTVESTEGTTESSIEGILVIKCWSCKSSGAGVVYEASNLCAVIFC